MNAATFRQLVTDARAKNPRCVYCKKEHTTTPLNDLMWMKGSKRIACARCPEAFEVMTMPSKSSEVFDV